MEHAIGNTPLVPLRRLVEPGMARVLVKLELCNPTGSHKDRMALALIEEAERRGELRPGKTVLECTGGSTGSSLAFVCAFKGYRFQVISSDAFAQEKLETMRAFGAELLIEPSLEGKITPDLWPRMMARADRLRAQGDYYYTNQFHNRDALVGYRKMGEELLEAEADAFCAAVGTAGLLMGVATVLREANPQMQIYALEPATSAVLSGGPSGSHQVEGTAAGFVPPMYDATLVTAALPISEEEARRTARALAREEGIFAGTSTGLNVTAALELARRLGPEKTVVTVACDSGLKYLAGDLFRR
ncbi:cysteine synthase [bacterium SCN 62-11]|nr:MAG: cysteine synthase [bacterium SCN 62-11]